LKGNKEGKGVSSNNESQTGTEQPKHQAKKRMNKERIEGKKHSRGRLFGVVKVF